MRWREKRWNSGLQVTVIRVRSGSGISCHRLGRLQSRQWHVQRHLADVLSGGLAELLNRRQVALALEIALCGLGSFHGNVGAIHASWALEGDRMNCERLRGKALLVWVSTSKHKLGSLVCTGSNSHRTGWGAVVDSLLLSLSSSRQCLTGYSDPSEHPEFILVLKFGQAPGILISQPQLQGIIFQAHSQTRIICISIGYNENLKA